jgi:xanthine dehydrogenase molybdopterin-binding subunit B
MEPHVALAARDPDGGLTIFDSTQGASADRDTLARLLGLAPDRVRVVAPHVGGVSGPRSGPGSTRSWPRSPPTRPAATLPTTPARLLS